MSCREKNIVDSENLEASYEWLIKHLHHSILIDYSEDYFNEKYGE